MRHHRPMLASALICIATLCCVSCQTTGVFVVSRLALHKQPLAIAVVVDPAPTTAIAPFNPFSSYLPLQLALADALKQPVSVDSCFAFQASQGLANGWYAMAIVTPAQYAALPPAGRSRVLAVPADRKGRAMRSAVLVVPARSAARTVADLRGKVVAFGPADDSRMHHAALQFLGASGIARSDLSLEVLPVPGSLKHFPNSKAVAQSVLNESSFAGFVDESFWDEIPEASSKSDVLARSQFRVLGRTAELPDHLLLASTMLDAPTSERIQRSFLELGERKPDVARSLQIGGYIEPPAEALTNCDALKPERNPIK